MTGGQFIHMIWTIAKCGYGALFVLGVAVSSELYSWDQARWWESVLTLAARMTGAALGLHFCIRWLVPILERLAI